MMMESSIPGVSNSRTKPLKVKKKAFAAKLAEKKRGSQVSIGIHTDVKVPNTETAESYKQKDVQDKLNQADSEPDKGVIHVSTKERRVVTTPRNTGLEKSNKLYTDCDISDPKKQPISIDNLQNGVKLKYDNTKPLIPEKEKPFSLKSIQDMPFIPQPPSTPCRTPRKSDYNHSFDETVIHKRGVIGPSENIEDGKKQVLLQRSDSLPDISFDAKSQVSNKSSPPFPVLSIKEARTRSLSIGKVDNAVLFMGAEELERYFPNRQLHVWIGSWNMGELKNLSSPMTDFLLPESCKYVQNMYVVGTQENAMNRKEWEVLLQNTLGPMFVLFHSVSHGSLHLAVFIHRDLIWFCSVPEEDIVSTRAMTMVKTKGAIAISLSFFGTSMLFINSHLTSDQSKKRDRILDYEKIISGLKLPKSSRSSKDATANFDCVYWCGDLNFRIERKKITVEQKVTEITERSIQNYDELIKADQLTHILTEGRIFHGFQEGRITFPPTYKYDVSSNQFDTSNKSRIPSYTDRIMFRSKKRNHISCLDYNSVMSVKVSDHKPVYGIYQMALKPSKEIRPSAAGHFDKEVYLKANQKLASQNANTGNQKNSSICSIQ